MKKDARPAPKLRLYVWTGFSPDYGSGLAFAIAKDETQARELVVKSFGNKIYEWGYLRVYPLTRPMGRPVGGGA